MDRGGEKEPRGGSRNENGNGGGENARSSKRSKEGKSSVAKNSGTTSTNHKSVATTSSSGDSQETKSSKKKARKRKKRKDRLRKGWGSLRLTRSEEGLQKLWPQRLPILSARGESSEKETASDVDDSTDYSLDNKKRQLDARGDQGRPRSLSSGSEPAAYPVKSKKGKKGDKKSKKKENLLNGENAVSVRRKAAATLGSEGSMRGTGGWIGGEGGGRVGMGLDSIDDLPHIKRAQSDLSSLRQEKSGAEGSGDEMVSMREYFSRYLIPAFLCC